jgi:hypothetical protein
MAKILCTFATVERFVLQKDPVDRRLDPALPADLGMVHACAMPEEPWVIGSR